MQMPIEEKHMWGYCMKMATCMTYRQVSVDTNSTDSLVSNSATEIIHSWCIGHDEYYHTLLSKP